MSECLTSEKLQAAKAVMDKADENHFKHIEQRQAEGLPPWDIVISGELWPEYKDEGIKAGVIKEAEGHYVIDIDFCPASRVILSWGAGMKNTIPAPPTQQKD